ncbi:hypothetical protein NDU88_005503 [Pleurodeles waltl]|uniref:Uncharacterized protein n=1 Tax=Pleurodeles waltl TaxID=8319 RepID=A0AAV7TAQ0_PLEWA|nr:hypothetical protein NDU88_005503 [Pleurodeles waltl]
MLQQQRQEYKDFIKVSLHIADHIKLHIKPDGNQDIGTSGHGYGLWRLHLEALLTLFPRFPYAKKVEVQEVRSIGLQRDRVCKGSNQKRLPRSAEIAGSATPWKGVGELEKSMYTVCELPMRVSGVGSRNRVSLPRGTGAQRGVRRYCL